MAPLSPDVEKQLQTAQRSLLQLTKEAMALLGELGVPNRDPPIGHLERAQAMLALSQTVQAVHSLLMKASGREIKDSAGADAFIQNAKRLDLYEKKINKAVTAELLKKLRPTVSLNVGAANRFIEAAIPGQLTTEQREALRAVGDQVKRKAEEQDKAQAEKNAKKAKGGAAANKDAATAFLSQLTAQRQTERIGISAPTTAGEEEDTSQGGASIIQEAVQQAQQ